MIIRIIREIFIDLLHPEKLRVFLRFIKLSILTISFGLICYIGALIFIDAMNYGMAELYRLNILLPILSTFCFGYCFLFIYLKLISIIVWRRERGMAIGKNVKNIDKSPKFGDLFLSIATFIVAMSVFFIGLFLPLIIPNSLYVLLILMIISVGVFHLFDKSKNHY